MPIYSYKALDAHNLPLEGTTSGSSREDVAQELQKKGLTPVSVSQIAHETNTKQKLPLMEKVNFCRYVSTMLKSGLSITESINVIAEEATHPATKKILSDLSFGIQHGQTLSSVMAKYPNAFDNFFITIVQAGEVSGTLAQSFAQIEAQLRSEHSLKQKIGGALLYPAVVFSAMIGIGLIMVFFVLPQIGKVFLNLRLPLAAPVKLMFELSIIINSHKLLIIISGIIFLAVLIFLLQTKAGRSAFLKAITPIPVVKNLLIQIDIARFCRVFATLISSGVPITQALEISLKSLNFPKFKLVAPSITEAVTKGKPLSVAIKEKKVFPSLLTQMIAAGERAGTLDETLDDLGKFYEEEVENGVKNATQILEPILMLVVGIGVGVMILSVITPIYSVVNNIQNAR